MPVSVVEVAEGSNGALTTTPTVTITNTPIAGDYIYITYSANNGSRTVSSVTGLGATWAIVGFESANNGNTTYIWRGTGATSAGTATLSVTTTSNGSVRAFHVRGLTSTTAVMSIAHGSGTVDFNGPASLATLNQFVLVVGFVAAKASGNLLSGIAPGSGWVVQNSPATATGYHHTAYRIPSETPPTVNQTKLALGTSGARTIISVVIGTPVANSAIVGGDYAETLHATVGAISAQVGGAYAEVLTPIPPPTAGIGGAYAEVVTPPIPPMAGVISTYVGVLFEKIKEPGTGSGIYDSSGLAYRVFELTPTGLEERVVNAKTEEV